MFTSFYIEENREDIIIIMIMMDEAMPADVDRQPRDSTAGGT